MAQFQNKNTKDGVALEVGVNKPTEGKTLVDPNAPRPQVPAFWDDFGRQAAALFQVLNDGGPEAADSFREWLAKERANLNTKVT